jgi:DNA-directed RNA polymerase subunit RPC12/RpoP
MIWGCAACGEEAPQDEARAAADPGQCPACNP